MIKRPRRKTKNININEIITMAFCEGANFVNMQHTYGGLPFELFSMMGDKFNSAVIEAIHTVLYKPEKSVYIQHKNRFNPLLELLQALDKED